MSYQAGFPLQKAVFARLQADASVAALSGGRVHDAPPAESPATPDGEFVMLGEEVVRSWATADGPGAVHDFVVSVHSPREGFLAAKNLAAAVCAALEDAPLSLSTGRLVSLRFLQAQAERGAPADRRRIVLRFRALVEGA